MTWPTHVHTPSFIVDHSKKTYYIYHVLNSDRISGKIKEKVYIINKFPANTI